MPALKIWLQPPEFDNFQSISHNKKLFHTSKNLYKIEGGKGHDEIFIFFNSNCCLHFGLPNNHIVGFSNPVVVTGGSVSICRKSVLLMDANPVFVHLAPAEPSSISGTMAILDDDGYDIISLYPSSGSYDDPVFAFNGEVVATDRTTFEGLKALYR